MPIRIGRASMTKEKRKNFTPEDIKAISKLAYEDAKADRHEKVMFYIDLIMRKIGEGHFRVDEQGYIHIRVWGNFVGSHDDEIRDELRKHFSEVNVPWGGSLSTVIKVKP